MKNSCCIVMLYSALFNNKEIFIVVIRFVYSMGSVDQAWKLGTKYGTWRQGTQSTKINMIFLLEFR